MPASEEAAAHRPAKIELYNLKDDGGIPNNAALPLLVYHGALRPEEHGDDPAAPFEQTFAANGWRGTWRNGIFPYHHYHSTAHEVLGIARGEATVRLGGERGVTLRVRPGDVLVIPAGVGHRNLGADPDLLVVGAYPEGQEGYDLCRGGPDERPRALANIARVPLPATDPVYGADGPLIEHWHGKPPAAEP
ncbi:MAG TPA: cupin domain-containing protein [Geminicoccaceae bacterium]|nr:cupin domain-containing protein [Geminicoccaceae bacterium]